MNDLAELFKRDPNSLTLDDIKPIVARMREAQAQFELGVAKPVAERKKQSSKTDSFLKDLGLK